MLSLPTYHRRVGQDSSVVRLVEATWKRPIQMHTHSLPIAVSLEIALGYMNFVLPLVHSPLLQLPLIYATSSSKVEYHGRRDKQRCC